MNAKALHIKVQVTRKQNVLLQKLLHAKGVTWDTGDPCDGRVNADASYLRLSNGKLFRILGDAPWHFVQEVNGELYHWHAAMELIEKTKPLEPPKNLEKMSTAANEYTRRGWRLEEWLFGDYILMSAPGSNPCVLRIYENGLVEMTDPITGRFKKV